MLTTDCGACAGICAGLPSKNSTRGRAIDDFRKWLPRAHQVIPRIIVGQPRRRTLRLQILYWPRKLRSLARVRWAWNPRTDLRFYLGELAVP